MSMNEFVIWGFDLRRHRLSYPPAQGPHSGITPEHEYHPDEPEEKKHQALVPPHEP